MKIHVRVTDYLTLDQNPPKFEISANGRAAQSDYCSNQFVETHPLCGALGSIPESVSGSVHQHNPSAFWLHYGPGVNSTSNRNVYQEYSMEVKAAGAYG